MVGFVAAIVFRSIYNLLIHNGLLTVAGHLKLLTGLLLEEIKKSITQKNAEHSGGIQHGSARG